MSIIEGRRDSRASLPSMSGNVRSILASKFQQSGDLDDAVTLLPILRREEEEAREKPQELRIKVAARASTAKSDAVWLSVSLQQLVTKVSDIKGSCGAPGAVVVEDVAGLVKEVVRVEQLRHYAERVLQLEQMVGVLEDAVTSSTAIYWDRRFVGGSMINQGPGGRLLEAVKLLQSAEDVVTSISRCGPEYTQLIWAIHLRLDQAASALRAAGTADLQSSLKLLAWPPPLMIGDKEFRDDARRANPFLEANDSVSTRFKDCFLVLSILQAVQQLRTSQRDKEKTKESLLYKPLWAMEELVSPLASQVDFHFRKWVQKPELVCALAYSLCQEFVDTVDVYLQLVIDDASLAGYSAREEWVLCLSSMARSFFKEQVFPHIADDVQKGAVAVGPAASLWLHTIDQILAFDSRMKSLLVQESGAIRFRPGVDALIQHGIVDKSRSGFGCMRVFADRPDWLDLWAQIEFADAWEKLRVNLGLGEAWLVKRRGRAAGSLSPTGGVPSGAVAVLAAMWSVIDRCRTLPESELRLAFVRGGASPIAREYHDALCDHIEGFTDQATELEMLKVAVCVNAAQFCEYKLQEWSEDYFFLELRVADLCKDIKGGLEHELDDDFYKKKGLAVLEGTIFDDEIELFADFRTAWLNNLVSVITNKFEKNCKTYVSSIRSWFTEGVACTDGNLESQSTLVGAGLINGTDVWRIGVSGTFVEPLIVLQNELEVLSGVLQEENFTELCRNLMTTLDVLFVSSFLPRGVKFSKSGAQQLVDDVTALFHVFRPFFVRPAMFFKGLSDTVKAAQDCVK